MVHHHGPRRRPDPRQAGRVKFLTVVLFLGAIVGGYFLYVWGPLEIDNFDVGHYCKQAVNKTWRYKDTEETRHVFRNLLRRMGTHPVDEDGETVQVPNIHPTDDDLRIQIDQSVTPPVLSVDVSYPRTVALPGLKRNHTFWFHTGCQVKMQSVSFKSN